MQYTLSTHPELGHRTIRNICITDCTRNEDYYRIMYLCGDYDDETEMLSIIEQLPSNDVPIGYGMLLYDNNGIAFMYFWSQQAPTTSTHHFMTVQEFYDLFDPHVETPYEFW